MTRVNRTPCPRCGEGVLRGGWCSKCSYRTPEARQREQEAQRRRRVADSADDHVPAPQTWAPRGGAGCPAPTEPSSGAGTLVPRGSAGRPIPPEPPSGGRGPAPGAVTLDGTVVDVGDIIKETVDLRSALVAGAAVRGILLLPLRLAGFLVGCLFAPLRFLLMPSLFMGRSKPQQDSLVVLERHPFVVQDASGARHDCYIRGELRGSPVRLGERVRAQGRVERGTGLLHVARLTNTVTGVATTGYIDMRVRRQPYVVAGAIIFMVLLLLMLRGML